MKSSKIILLGLVSTLSVAVISCKKFLDVQPKDQVLDSQTITDGSSALSAVRGMYYELESNDYYGATFQYLGWFSGDNVQYVGSTIVNKQLTNHTVSSDLALLNQAWTAIYNTINRANNVLAKVQPLPTNTTTLTDTLKKQYLGEAYFIRALSYFDLVRTWGGVQLVLTPTITKADVDAIKNIKRSTVAETYVQILKDLAQAEILLPNSANRIRATRKIAYALHARVALYQNDWTNAELYAGKLIDDSNYALIGPYNSFFANNAANTKESIFELYYTTTVQNGNAKQWEPTSAGGNGWITPTNDIVTLLLDPTIGGNRSSLIQTITTAGVKSYFGNLYYRTTGTDPVYVIRIAEMYLIRAEARAHIGTNLTGINSAESDLDAIRTRAGLPGTTATSQADLIQAIENENRVEFALEDHRWYDLVRTNRAAAVLGITTDKYLLPIPYAQTLLDGDNLN